MKTFCFGIIFLFFFSSVFDLMAGDVRPVNKDGAKWQIGFYEGGPWPDYQDSLLETVQALIDMGWIEKIKLPEQQDDADTRSLWIWLSKNASSSYLDFVEDAYWSANWDDSLRKENKRACLDRLRSGTLDLLFAVGTWAGQDLANNSHHVPTIVMSTSDPIAAGIVKSADDSGFDHVVAECDPTRYKRQIMLFHDIVQFHRLGIVYEDTPDGRSYANLKDIEETAKERGFEVVRCVAPDTNMTEEEAVEGYVECVVKIAPVIDAFYFTSQRGAEPKNIARSLQPLFAHKVRTWSSWGLEHVKMGVLLSVGRKDLKLNGRFYADNLARIFNGAKPRDLSQILKEEPILAINTETARIINYEIPPNLLKIAGFVVLDIQKE